MMSTAILMSMGAEQSTKHPVAQEAEKLEGPTFAEALDARVGISLETASKDSAAGAPSGLSNAETEPPAKNLINVSDLAPDTKAQSFDAPVGTSAVIGVRKDPGDPVTGTLLEMRISKAESIAKSLNVPELTAATKAKISAGQTMFTGSATKEITAGNSNPSQLVSAVGSQVRGKTEGPGTEVAEPFVNTEEIAAEVPMGLPAGSTLKTQSGEVNSVENQGEQNLNLTPSPVTPVIPKEATATGKAPETATANKTIKTQGSDETPKVASKSGAAEAHAIADGAKPAPDVVAQIPPPLPGQTVAYVAPVVAPTVSPDAKSDGSNRAEGIAPSTGNGTTLIPGAPSAVDGSNHRNLVQSEKNPASNTDTTRATSGDPTATAKTDAKAERSPAVATNVGGDSDIKGRTAGEPPVALIHPAASVGDVSSGTVPSSVTGIVKPPNGEHGAQTAGSPTGLRERDGSGAVERSMEPMPRTLSATPTALEVGIPDGTHGWLKVRAEMSDGVVNASVSAPSAASQEMLHRELPSLTAYLQSEKVAVNTVVVHPIASPGAEPRGYQAGTESGGSGQTPQRSNEGGEQGQGSLRATADGADEVAGYQGLHGVGEDATLPRATYPGGGSWLSVRA
jgi:hypothetical protein